MISKYGDFSIWSDKIIDPNSDETISISVTDGEKVWESNVDQRDMPPARRSQKWAEFVPLVLSALRSGNLACTHYIHDFDIQGTDMILSITEHISGASLKSLMLRKTLQESTDSKRAISNFLGRAARAMTKYSDDIKVLQDIESNLTLSIGHLTHDLNNLVNSKEELQTEMLRKMCLLLNSKSREILHLRSKIPDIDANNESDGSNSANDSDKNVISPVKSMKSTKLKKPAKFLRLSSPSTSSSSPSSSSLQHVAKIIAARKKYFDESKVSRDAADICLIDDVEDEPVIKVLTEEITPTPIPENNYGSCYIKEKNDTTSTVEHSPNTDKSKTSLDESQRIKKKKRKLCESSDDSDDEQTPLRVCLKSTNSS